MTSVLLIADIRHIDFIHIENLDTESRNSDTQSISDLSIWKFWRKASM